MRVKRWERRLQETVERFRALPFDWATNNCSHFAGCCVEAVTGQNPVSALDGSYTDEAGAMAAIAAHGSDIEEAAASMFPAQPPAQARRGDLGIAEVGGRKVLLVILGQFAAGPGPRCLSFVPRTNLTASFRVD
jgi:hypothetical protein